ncbi:MAG: hypothetical protein JXR77_14380 [Lentisphaeria bacterium]|nr:hypothetical protein [Lentisphaeria bacterium]
MILFRCPACGSVHRADPQYAGGTLPCRQCGGQVPIPQQSDAECALVYRSGESEEGTPMTRDEIRVKLVSGELSEMDLIWEGNTWRPLAETFGGVHEGEGLKLKRKERATDATAGAGTPDLSAAVQKVDISEVVPGETRRIGTRRLPKKSKDKAPDAPISGARAAEAPAVVRGDVARPKKKHGKAYYTVQAVLLLLAVTLGYKFGFGPLISSYRGLPTYVVVQNSEDVEYVAKLGLRRLTEPVYKNSLANLQLYVGMPERQTLRIEPKTPGEGEPFRLKVPVRPGGTTVVNLKAKSQFHVYDLPRVREQKLDTPELKALGEEIAANRAPTSAIKVSRQIRDLAASAFLGSKNDVIFQSTQYDVDKEMLYILRSKPPPKQDRKADAAAPRSPKPFLTLSPTHRVDFANGYARHSTGEDASVERAASLPVSALNLSRSRIIKVNSPRVVITGNDQTVTLNIQIQDQKVNMEEKTFNGKWEYRASCQLEGPDRNRWDWKWTYSGQADKGGKRYALELSSDVNGNEQRRIRQL